MMFGVLIICIKQLNDFILLPLTYTSVLSVFDWMFTTSEVCLVVMSVSSSSHVSSIPSHHLSVYLQTLLLQG